MDKVSVDSRFKWNRKTSARHYMSKRYKTAAISTCFRNEPRWADQGHAIRIWYGVCWVDRRTWIFVTYSFNFLVCPQKLSWQVRNLRFLILLEFLLRETRNITDLYNIVFKTTPCPTFIVINFVTRSAWCNCIDTVGQWIIVPQLLVSALWVVKLTGAMLELQQTEFRGWHYNLDWLILALDW